MSNLSTLLPAGASGKTIDAIADGAIVTKKPVILTSASKAAVIVEIAGALGTASAAGTSYRAGNNSGACYHTGINRTILSFPNSINSYYATCTTATISGTTMTMNTPTVINSTACQYAGCAYDETQNVVVFFYKYNGGTNKGKVRAATVSGNSFSFGSETNAFADTTLNNNPGDICNLNDSSVALAWGDGTGSGATVQAMTISGTTLTLGTQVEVSSTRGWEMRMASGKKGELLCQMGSTSDIRYNACTVSGTTVTAGTVTVIGSDTSTHNTLNSGYWSGYTTPESTYIVVYKEPGSSTHNSLARVATVSGTTLTLNAITDIDADPSSNPPKLGWGGSATQALLYYRSVGTSSKGYITELSYSGTTITEGAQTEVGTQRYSMWGVAWDPDAEKSIFMYQDGSNSDAASVNCYTPSTTNLTSSNFLGIADAAISNAASGTIVVRGGTATGLSSLTAGAKYYLQNDGSLTSPGEAIAYNIKGATYDSVSFSIGNSEGTPTGMAFNNNGTKMYVVGEVTDRVYQYSLSTAYDLSTASNDSVSLSVSSQLQPAPRSVVFNNDGTALYVCGPDDGVFQYTLSTAYNLATASYANKTFDVTSQELYPCELIFNSDGTSMYTVGSQNDTVYQYTLSTAFDVSTASYASKSMDAGDGQTSPTGLAFNSDGTKLFVSGETTPKINQYSLSTAYDVSTGSFDSISYTYTQGTGILRNINFNGDGTKFYLVDSGPDAIYQYTTGGGATSSVNVGLAISTTALLLTGDS